MKSNKKKSRSVTDILKTSKRIHVASNLYPSIVPDVPGIIISFCIGNNFPFTSFLCHKKTGFSVIDCAKILSKLEEIGMLKLEYTPTTPNGYRIYTVTPFVELSVISSDKKRRRHAPKVTTLSVVNTWLGYTTGLVDIGKPT
jgi:hypothetical protein